MCYFIASATSKVGGGGDDDDDDDGDDGAQTHTQTKQHNASVIVLRENSRKYYFM